MTRGEIIRERKLVKAEQTKAAIEKGIAEFIENKGDYIGQISVLIAFVLFVGAVGTVEISESIPESSILVGSVSLLWITVYGLIAMMKGE